MAFSPIAFTAPNYRDYKNNWIKAYEPGTTTPKTLSLDSTGSVLAIKVELNKDGFIESAGGAIVIPYIDGAYDLWMFPDEQSADDNDTSSALRIADDITAGISSDKILTRVEDKQTLIAGQLIVAFSGITVDRATIYVGKNSGDRGKLFLDDDYTLTGSSQITLTSSFSAGTKLIAESAELVDRVESIKPMTLAEAVSNTAALDGQIVQVTDRADGQFTYSAGQSANTYNIVQCTGVPTLALVLRVEGHIVPEQWGAVAEALGSLTGFDNSPVIQFIYNYMTTNNVGVIRWGVGAYYLASVVNQPIVNAGLGTNGIINQGTGRKTTEIFTDKDIDMFTHQDSFVVKDLSIVQRGAEGVTKFTGVAFRANGQCRFCHFENLGVWWFKFGNLQRFSLWNTYKSISYNGNLCGIKLARSSDMEDQTNPSPAGTWNAGDGWFHNANSFDTIVFNGDKESSGGRGEIGFWGAIQGCTFTNITAQNYERDGTIPNQTIPIGQVSTCMEIVGGGPTSANTFNNSIVGFYIERSFKGLKAVDNKRLDIKSWFVQGQAGGENMLEVENSDVNVVGQTGQTPGFTNSVKATDSNITFNKPIAASGSARDLTDSYLSENGIPINPTVKTVNVTMSAGTGGGTITIDTNADLLAYTRQGQEVTVTGRVDILSVSALTGEFFNIDGLPFSPVNAPEMAGNTAVAVSYFVNGGAIKSQPGIIIENASSIRVYIDASTVLAGDSIYLSATYISDDFS